MNMTISKRFSSIKTANKLHRIRCSLFLKAAIISVFAIPTPTLGNTLLHESFDDNNLSSRGWYDNTSPVITNNEHALNSIGSLEFQFKKHESIASSGGAIRHKFQETETVFVSYYVKYSANWEGSNMSSHPHEFLLLTNVESDWAAPAETHLTAYIEQNEGTPMLLIQDTLNVDQSRIGTDLSHITEFRATAGCNGDSDGYVSTCYTWGGLSRNGKKWSAGQIYFTDDPGPRYKNDWHLIEAQFTLNSIINDKGIPDGILRLWYDGSLIIEHDDVLFRTAQHPNMKFNQLLIAPYIGGSGSPIDQTFWVDEVSVSTTRTTTGTVEPSPPTNVQAN